MSKVFFDDLGIPAPDVNLEVGAGERSAQIDRIMTRFDPVVRSERPDAVLVVGDVTSTVACARVARSHGVKVVHVEAGLRSFDRSMPEELNRVETDQISDFLFVTEPSGMQNIERERLDGRAYLVGNVMIDSLVAQLDHARAMKINTRFGLEQGRYAVATFHRPSNVDEPDALRAVVEIIQHTCARIPMVLPLHPRTKQALQRFDLLERLQQTRGLHVSEPLGYLEFLSLVSGAALVITDSGGIQEETTYLGIPCLTMRENTERPVTVTHGTNRLCAPGELLKRVAEVLSDGTRPVPVIPLWDGRTAGRVVAAIRSLVNVGTGPVGDAAAGTRN
jgi:UDP-N-acetylglucosamine 2-epimerase (non-hydrolysing)